MRKADRGSGERLRGERLSSATEERDAREAQSRRKWRWGNTTEASFSARSVLLYKRGAKGAGWKKEAVMEIYDGGALSSAAGKESDAREAVGRVGKKKKRKGVLTAHGARPPSSSCSAQQAEGELCPRPRSRPRSRSRSRSRSCSRTQKEQWRDRRPARQL